MKVLMTGRGDVFERPGGDTVQMVETSNGLKQLGVEVTISSKVPAIDPCYDLYHVFNCDRLETYEQCKAVKSIGKPLLLSTVYWDKSEFRRMGVDVNLFLNLPLRFAHMVRFGDLVTDAIVAAVRDGCPKTGVKDPKRPFSSRTIVRSNLALCDLLLPNSVAEANLLSSQFGVAPKRIRVIPNGVDSDRMQADRTEIVRKYGVEDFVLCVGRIEDRKNTIRLIRACKLERLQLVLVGRLDARSPYGQRVSKEGKDAGALFIDELPSYSPLLGSAYAAAKVHALPSWYETPGLSSLEAASLGCLIVSTDRGSARDYFGELASYCSPRSVESIRAALRREANLDSTSRRDALKEMISSKYTWTGAARLTYNAYREIVE